jgi:hypothetical protein
MLQEVSVSTVVSLTGEIVVLHIEIFEFLLVELVRYISLLPPG